MTEAVPAGNSKFAQARAQLDKDVVAAFDIHKADEEVRNSFVKKPREDKDESDLATGVKKFNESIQEDKKKDQFVNGMVENAISGDERSASNERIRQINEEIVRAQKQFVDIKLKKEKAFSGVYEYFRNLGDKNALNVKVQKAIGDDKEIAEARQWYQNALEAKKNILLSEAKERGSRPEDLLKVLLEFEENRINDLSKSYDQVRTEQHEGKIPGKIGEGLMKISKWYQEQPLKVKIGMAAVFIGGGYLVAHGLVAATMGKVIAGAIISRRGMMSAMTGTGAALWAEKHTKESRQDDINKRAIDFTTSLEGKDENERMDMLMRRLQGFSDDVDKDLDKMRYENKRNLTLGVTAGVALVIVPKFISGLAGDGFHWVMEKMGFVKNISDADVAAPSQVDTLKHNGSNLPLTTKTGVLVGTHNFNEVTPNGGAPIDPDKFNHVTSSGAMNAAEQAQHVKEAAAAETVNNVTGERIPIEKGNGIRDTLFKYLEKNHPEVKDREYVVTQMVRDFRHDNPGKNLDLVFKNNSLVINDHNGFHITGIEGNDNWGNGNLDHHTGGIKPSPTIEDTKLPEKLSPDNLPMGEKSGFVGNEVYDPNQLQINTAKTYLHSIDNTLSSEHASNGSFNPDGTYKENFVPTQGMMEAAAERARVTKVLKELFGDQINFRGGVSNALRKLTAEAGIFNKHEYWQHLKDMPFDQAEKDPKAGKALAALFKQYSDNGVLGKDAMPLDNKHETVGKWLSRVVDKATKLQEVKIDANANVDAKGYFLAE